MPDMSLPPGHRNDQLSASWQDYLGVCFGDPDHDRIEIQYPNLSDTYKYYIGRHSSVIIDL